MSTCRFGSNRVNRRRRACACVCLAVLATGCSSEVPLAVTPPPPVVPSSLQGSDVPEPLTPLVPLDIPTYEHSGQAVHPDVVRFAAAWNGWEYWMAMTPYPRGKPAYENPSILVSHDGLKWQVPDGARNPLARTPAKKGYNSDPDLTYDASRDRLVLIYREVTATHNLVHAVESADGVRWTPPRLAFSRRNHGMVSPTIAFPAGSAPRLWYVDAGPKRCSERTTRVTTQHALSIDALQPAAIARGWSIPRRAGLVQPGHNIWHVDVSWIPERQEYWAVYVAYPGYACWGQDLYFARSSDGVKWTTYDGPFLRHGANAWTGSTLYRASVMYDASRDAVQFFISAEAPDHTWRLGYVDYQLRTFLTTLARSVPDPVATSGLSNVMMSPEIDP